MTLHWKWLNGDFDEEIDAKLFGALKIDLNGRVITRSYDRVTEMVRDSVNVVIFPLALAIIKNWWTLLYEPRKSDDYEDSSGLRHSLDCYMNGFCFPAVALWSGGADTVTIEHPNVSLQHSRLEFLPTGSSFTHLQRREVEENLFELIQAVIERAPSGPASCELSELWNRVLKSFGDDEERQYCEAAGRLGVDPYDPDAEDISALANGLSGRLFSDICEAATLPELQAATDWAREGTRHFDIVPSLDVSHFGAFPEKNPQMRIWEQGYEAARTARKKLNLEGDKPRRVVDSIFGTAVRADSATVGGNHTNALEGIVDRNNGKMRIALPMTSARLRRSRLCRASYLAWKAAEGDTAAVTTATTIDQQASRAFAAELLAPKDLLWDLAGQDGLTPELIETFAEENVCPEQTIIWQAYNHQIPLRGVSLPAKG
ncbi:MAG: hypothetical protein HXX10_10775 [Rhodoplanes sp.]|uniref:hypothetical protein n=1 Tax=Rhodoplanes sp. TaxID=1968906 RepID=UPI00179D257B|nr:hypothetical protein [Rhodoplanes sp.]NVO14510.1 hypothetical protein [Rhodoplanes sp.]